MAWNTLLCLSSAAVSVAAAALALHSTSPKSAPGLVGAWSGSYNYVSDNGVQKAKVHLIIRKQDGSLISGIDAWDVREGAKPSRKNSTPIYGVVSWDGHSVDIAENGGFYRIAMVNDREMEATFLRTNSYVSAFRVTLRRQ